MVSETSFAQQQDIFRPNYAGIEIARVGPRTKHTLPVISFRISLFRMNNIKSSCACAHSNEPKKASAQTGRNALDKAEPAAKLAAGKLGHGGPNQKSVH
jgi:hypothetical protein